MENIDLTLLAMAALEAIREQIKEETHETKEE